MKLYFSGLTLAAALMFSLTGCAPADPVIDADPYGDTGSNTSSPAETPAVSEMPAEDAPAEDAPAEDAPAEDAPAE